jgi:hypothetical protein
MNENAHYEKQVNQAISKLLNITSARMAQCLADASTNLESALRDADERLNMPSSYSAVSEAEWRAARTRALSVWVGERRQIRDRYQRIASNLRAAML